MIFRNPILPCRPLGRAALGSLLWAGTLAGLPAFAQPAPANGPQAQALPALPTVAEFLAAVRAHPDVIITHAAYEEALANRIAAELAHGPGSPQAAQTEEILALQRGTWIAAVVASYDQQMNHLRNQGHSALALHTAYGSLNLFGAN